MPVSVFANFSEISTLLAWYVVISTSGGTSGDTGGGISGTGTTTNPITLNPIGAGQLGGLGLGTLRLIPAGAAVTNVSLTGNVATLTTRRRPHGLAIGQSVTVAGLADTIFNGTWTVTKGTVTTFSFALAHANVASASDTGTATGAGSMPANTAVLGTDSAGNLVPSSAGAGSFVSPPASDTATGTAGQYAADSSFFYVCTAANTWKRVAWTFGSF